MKPEIAYCDHKEDRERKYGLSALLPARALSAEQMAVLADDAAFAKHSSNRYNHLPLSMMEASVKSSAGKPRIVLGADHAGFHAKEKIKNYLQSAGYTVSDTGTFSEESVDYPDFAIKVARRVQQGRDHLGILVCGTGIGMAMAANKIGGIRAAVAHDALTARMSREHNAANVLAMGARVLSDHQIIEVTQSFISAEFAGGRHQRRVDKISELDEEPKHKQ